MPREKDKTTEGLILFLPNINFEAMESHGFLQIDSCKCESNGESCYLAFFLRCSQSSSLRVGPSGSSTKGESGQAAITSVASLSAPDRAPSIKQTGWRTHGGCLSCQPKINHSAERDRLLAPIFFCLIAKSEFAIYLHGAGRGGL